MMSREKMEYLENEITRLKNEKRSVDEDLEENIKRLDVIKHNIKHGMSVSNIIVEYLKKNKCDGLVNGDCFCGLTDGTQIPCKLFDADLCIAAKFSDGCGYSPVNIK